MLYTLVCRAFRVVFFLLSVLLLACVTGGEAPESVLSTVVAPVTVESANEALLSAIPAAEVLPATAIPITVLFAETDIARNIIESSEVQDGIFQVLSARGFNLVESNFRPEQFFPADIREFYTLSRDSYGSAEHRLVIGIAGITEVDESDGFMVNVYGSLRVYNLLEEEIIMILSTSAHAQGSDSARAVHLAFANLGQSFGNLLADGLP